MIIRVSHIFTVIDAYDRCFENHRAGTGLRRDSLLSACCDGIVSARLDVGSNVCENRGDATKKATSSTFFRTFDQQVEPTLVATITADLG
mgnify:CR=1 FL=1